MGFSPENAFVRGCYRMEGGMLYIVDIDDGFWHGHG